METPVVEQAELYTTAMTQSEIVAGKEMYVFQDRERSDGEAQLLALRPEGTAGTTHTRRAT